ncbi:MAG: hypothetical protein LAO18_08665, partial [Acidobacteriia bacterium]|nr:hypothetical protein [Terriglobia bacterium]
MSPVPPITTIFIIVSFILEDLLLFFIQSVAGMWYPIALVQNCTNPNRFNGFGLGAMRPVEAMAYSAFAPQN